MNNLNGDHDRILNLEPWRAAAKRQPHDRLSAPSVAGSATWLMQRGVPIWQAAGYLGMSAEMVERTYGHHHL